MALEPQAGLGPQAVLLLAVESQLCLEQAPNLQRAQQLPFPLQVALALALELVL